MASGKIMVDKRTKKRIFGTVITMALVAVFIALTIISIANDMFAFIKPDGTVTLTLNNELTPNELGILLEEQGVVSNPYIFSLYVRSKLKNDTPLSFSAPVKLERSMSYREILSELSKAK